MVLNWKHRHHYPCSFSGVDNHMPLLWTSIDTARRGDITQATATKNTNPNSTTELQRESNKGYPNLRFEHQNQISEQNLGSKAMKPSSQYPASILERFTVRSCANSSKPDILPASIWWYTCQGLPGAARGCQGLMADIHLQTRSTKKNDAKRTWSSKGSGLPTFVRLRSSNTLKPQTDRPSYHVWVSNNMA